MTNNKASVFVSYSHADSNWLTRLQVHLKPLERLGKIELWSDTRILAGEKWRKEIEEALDRCKIAILLISADFIASDFIANNELPPLLKAAQENGTVVLPVVVNYSSFLRTPELSVFQAINDPAYPLESLHRPEQEKILDSLHARIDSLLREKIKETESESFNSGNGHPVPKSVSETSSLTTTKLEQKIYTLLNINNDFELIIPLVRVNGDEELDLIVQAESNEDAHLMRRIQRDYREKTIIVAYGNIVFVGKILKVDMDFRNNMETWTIHVKRQESRSVMSDINYNGVTPDEQAEIRVRRILLNESEREMSASDFHKFSEIKRFDPVLNNPSPIPIIYSSNRSSPYLFDLLRLKAAISLYASLSISEIYQLEFYESEDGLYVRFSGDRRSAYSNIAPRRIKLEGKVNLSSL